MTIAQRVAQRFSWREAGANPELELMKSLAGLIKKGGRFVSDKQAAFLWNIFRAVAAKHPDPMVVQWGSRFRETGDNRLVGQLVLLDPRFGRRDVSRRRYYGTAYVVDGAGVVAAGKLKFDYVRQDLPPPEVPPPEGESYPTYTLKPVIARVETSFERTEEAIERYDHATKERERHKRVEANRPLIEKIQAIPGYLDIEILQSFVEQLERGVELSPAQHGIVQKYLKEEGALPGQGEWRQIYERLFKEFEDRVVEPIVHVAQKHQHDSNEAIAEHAGFDLAKVRGDWQDFKRKPSRAPEISLTGMNLIQSYLEDFLGWKKPSGLTGAGDILYYAQILGIKKKPPAAALRHVAQVSKFLEWLDRTSASKMTHGYEKRLQEVGAAAAKASDPFAGFHPGR